MNQQTLTDFPSYESPPVIEVVCGIRFKEITGFLAPHIGLLWQKFQPDYNEFSEHPNLVTPIETCGGQQNIEFRVDDKPPLPRVWFVHSKGNAVIQFQRDLFIYNWRKNSSLEEYPRFSVVFAHFLEHLEAFTKFISDNNLGELEPTQFELTYINHIPKGDGWESTADVGKVFKDFSWNNCSRRFLPHPDVFQWRDSFNFPNGSGRLNTLIRKAKRTRDGEEVLLFELGAKGIPINKLESTSLQNWFNQAHEWIVKGFSDLTCDQIQKDIWLRKE